MNMFKKLMMGGTALAIGATVVFPSVASAQSEDTGIVVTGTSIRGVAPVGSNLVAVTSEDIKATGAATLAGALPTIPSLSNFGSAGQGGTGSAFFQPSIHSLGASASNSTLNLIDGHRGPTGGTNHTFLDPSIIPMGMIERIEVLAEGASATYGSDAVAGVVNFITRRRYDGLQASASTQFIDSQQSYQFGVLAGNTWDKGAAVFAVGYSNQNSLPNTDADFTYPDHRAQGGTNFLSFSCDPAVVQPLGAGNLYLSPTATTSVANASANATCTNWGQTERIGEEVRYNAMARVTLDLTEKLTVGFDSVLSRRRGDSLGGAGTIQFTAFGPTATNTTQINPFYIAPPGTSTVNQTVRWDATSLFGPAHNKSDSDTYYVGATGDYKFTDDWSLGLMAYAGRDVSSTYSEGAINTSAANLALNGTTSTSGSTTAISVPGANTIVLRLPLTTANALDVWNPAATNRTSAATKAYILDNQNLLENTSGFQQMRAVVNGGLFDTAAGQVRVAFGAELLKQQLDQFVTRQNNGGPASAISQQLLFEFQRDVKSAFVEVNVPLVSPEMSVPLVDKFDVNVSYRYDDYSDMGETSNPRIAFGWDIVDGLRLRGNYATSFVAPPLTIFGDKNRTGAFGTSGYNSTTNNVNVPVSGYSLLPSMGIAGCTAASATCNINSLTGVVVVSGDPNAKAQEGDGWTLGVDFAPTNFLQGFRSQVTYWSTTFTGGVTGVALDQVIGTPAAQYLMTFYPACATAAEINQFANGIPQRSTLPTCTQYIYRQLNSNFLNLAIEGFDYSADYRIPTETMGDFKIGIVGTQFTKFDKSFSTGSTFDILDTSGNNGTFNSIGTTLRANLGWTGGGWSADAFVNYTGKYKNWSGNTVAVITLDPVTRNPIGGGDTVKANTTVDLRLGYSFSDESQNTLFRGLGATLSVRNAFDKDPPFYNSAAGFDGLAANPFGRIVSVSLTKDFF